MEKIWCMFSVENDYNQPPNNLVAWWKNKPSIETMAKDIGWTFPAGTDEATIAIVNIWSGKEVRLGDTDYRLDLINEGIQP